MAVPVVVPVVVPDGRGGERYRAPHSTERAVGWHFGSKPPGDEVCGELVPERRGHIPEIAPVDRQARRVAAKRKALRILQRERPVRSGPSRRNAEAVLDVLEKLVGPGEHAGDVRADRHEIAADRLQVEHVVKAGRTSYLGRGQLDELGEMLDPVGAQVPVLFLKDVQGRYEC